MSKCSRMTPSYHSHVVGSSSFGGRPTKDACTSHTQHSSQLGAAQRIREDEARILAHSCRPTWHNLPNNPSRRATARNQPRPERPQSSGSFVSKEEPGSNNSVERSVYSLNVSRDANVIVFVWRPVFFPLLLTDVVVLRGRYHDRTGSDVGWHHHRSGGSSAGSGLLAGQSSVVHGHGKANRGHACLELE